MITFTMPSGISHVWNGSHTVNVYLHGTEVDVWSLYPSDGRKPTQLEVFACILDREQLSTDQPLVKCQWCGIACQAATEYDTFTCADCEKGAR